MVNQTTRMRVLVFVAVSTFYILLATASQYLTGAAYASFGLYPDESSHYVSSVLVHDYLISGFHKSPLHFAVDYYVSYPFFAIGYWPPAFYAIGGLWMLIFGLGHHSALLLTAVMAALIGATIFQIVRQWCSTWVALVWGAIVLFVPSVIEGSSMFMVDIPITLFSFWALVELIRFSQAPDRPGHAMMFAFLGALTILTKYSGAFVCALPFALLVIDRTSRLWRKPWFWLQPVSIVVLCAPWILFTHKLSSAGLPPEADHAHQKTIVKALIGYPSGLAVLLGPVLCIAALISIVFLILRHVRTLEVCMYAAAPLCVVLFLMVSPVGAEPRYFLPAVPPLIVLIARAAAELKTVSRPYQLVGIAAAAVFVIAELFSGIALTPRYAPDTVGPVADYIVSKPQMKGKLILLPPGVEGPLIAEVIRRDSDRPSYVLLRPTKILSEAGWFGIKHVNYNTPEELQKTFFDNPIDFIVVKRSSTVAASLDKRAVVLDQLIKDTVGQFPEYWHREAVLQTSCYSEGCPQWEIYASAQNPSGRDSSVFRQRTLKRLKYWNSPKDDRAITY